MLWIGPTLSHHPSPIYNEHPVIKSQACFVQKFLADFDPTTIIIWSIKHYIGVFPLTSAALQVLTLDQSHHHDWRHHIPSLYKSNFGIGFNIIWNISVTGKIHLLFKIWKHVTIICQVIGYLRYGSCVATSEVTTYTHPTQYQRCYRFHHGFLYDTPWVLMPINGMGIKAIYTKNYDPQLMISEFISHTFW